MSMDFALIWLPFCPAILLESCCRIHRYFGILSPTQFWPALNILPKHGMRQVCIRLAALLEMRGKNGMDAFATMCAITSVVSQVRYGVWRIDWWGVQKSMGINSVRRSRASTS